jgi:hypothetical protein
MTLSLSDFFKQYDDDKIDIEKEIYFFSIGSAALIKEKGLDKLLETDCQQYPPFLQYAKKQYPDVKINIILIDRELKDLPYCICKSNIENGISNTVDDGWYIVNPFDNIFINPEQNIQVIAFKEYVSYLDNQNNQNTDYNIYDSFRMFHKYCINNGKLMFVHDFSGNPVHILARQFDNDLVQHKNKILYDINMRTYGGCYVDLSHSKNHPIIINKDNVLQIFNPYGIEHSGLIDIYKELDDNKFSENHMKNQILIYLYYQTCEFKNIFSIYRRFIVHVRNVKSGLTDKKEQLDFIDSLHKRSFELIDIRHGTNCIDMCKTYIGTTNPDDLNDLIHLLYQKLRSEMIKMFDFFLNASDTNKMVEQLFNELNHDKPYEWDKLVNKKYIDEIEKALCVTKESMKNIVGQIY